MTEVQFRLLRYDAAKQRLVELDALGEELVRTGVSIITNRGWVSGLPGLPYLLSTKYSRAFVFADEGSACAFIYEFGDLLDQPRVVERGGDE